MAGSLSLSEAEELELLDLEIAIKEQESQATPSTQTPEEPEPSFGRKLAKTISPSLFSGKPAGQVVNPPPKEPPKSASESIAAVLGAQAGAQATAGSAVIDFMGLGDRLLGALKEKLSGQAESKEFLDLASEDDISLLRKPLTVGGKEISPAKGDVKKTLDSMDEQAGSFLESVGIKVLKGLYGFGTGILESPATPLAGAGLARKGITKALGGGTKKTASGFEVLKDVDKAAKRAEGMDIPVDVKGNTISEEIQRNQFLKENFRKFEERNQIAARDFKRDLQKKSEADVLTKPSQIKQEERISIAAQEASEGIKKEFGETVGEARKKIGGEPLPGETTEKIIKTKTGLLGPTGQPLMKSKVVKNTQTNLDKSLTRHLESTGFKIGGEATQKFPISKNAIEVYQKEILDEVKQITTLEDAFNFKSNIGKRIYNKSEDFTSKDQAFFEAAYKKIDNQIETAIEKLPGLKSNERKHFASVIKSGNKVFAKNRRLLEDLQRGVKVMNEDNIAASFMNKIKGSGSNTLKKLRSTNKPELVALRNEINRGLLESWFRRSWKEGSVDLKKLFDNWDNPSIWDPEMKKLIDPSVTKMIDQAARDFPLTKLPVKRLDAEGAGVSRAVKDFATARLVAPIARKYYREPSFGKTGLFATLGIASGIQETLE